MTFVSSQIGDTWDGSRRIVRVRGQNHLRMRTASLNMQKDATFCACARQNARTWSMLAHSVPPFAHAWKSSEKQFPGIYPKVTSCTSPHKSSSICAKPHRAAQASYGEKFPRLRSDLKKSEKRVWNLRKKCGEIGKFLIYINYINIVNSKHRN